MTSTESAKDTKAPTSDEFLGQGGKIWKRVPDSCFAVLEYDNCANAGYLTRSFGLLSPGDVLKFRVNPFFYRGSRVVCLVSMARRSLRSQVAVETVDGKQAQMQVRLEYRVVDPVTVYRLAEGCDKAAIAAKIEPALRDLIIEGPAREWAARLKADVLERTGHEEASTALRARSKARLERFRREKGIKITDLAVFDIGKPDAVIREQEKLHAESIRQEARLLNAQLEGETMAQRYRGFAEGLKKSFPELSDRDISQLYQAELERDALANAPLIRLLHQARTSPPANENVLEGDGDAA